MSGLTHFLMDEVEMPLVEVVAAMEDAGYPVDVNFFNELSGKLEPEIAKIKKSIRRVAGKDFNPRSQKQLSTLLYKTLGLKVHSKTKNGNPSTDDKALKPLVSKHKVVSQILRFRKLDKIVSTYCTIPDQVGDDDRLRVDFNQLAAETGRFSSSSIIQTLPKKDEFAIRHGFRAREGLVIVGADFRQQELNVLAQVSGDKNMLAAIADGLDLHGLAAVKVFHLECEANAVELQHPDKRDQVKAIQFGLVYGKTAFGLSESLGISGENAEELIRKYFEQFPAVQKYIDKVHRTLLHEGYVDDVFGRRRHFSVVRQKVARKRYKHMTDEEKRLVGKINEAKRKAQNFVIQGAAATITKLAMIRCYRHIEDKFRDQVRMILTLHDELQFEVKESVLADFAGDLPELMCDLGLERFGFKLPFAVEVKAGPSWGEMTKW
jgi:DNA polymerase-1